MMDYLEIRKLSSSHATTDRPIINTLKQEVQALTKIYELSLEKGFLPVENYPGDTLMGVFLEINSTLNEMLDTIDGDQFKWESINQCVMFD